MSREERRAEKAARKAAKAEARLGEKIEDAYDESERTLSHEEACRDSVYTTSGTLAQIWICYMTQMNRFTKQRTVWLMAILLILMPVIYYLMISRDIIANAEVANTTMATILTLLPILAALMATVTCAAMLPTEFNERTVYLSLPLPVTRGAFYIGKFLSGLSLAAGTVFAAYGIALLLSMGGAEAYTGPIVQSMILVLCGTFFFCAMTYMFSAKSKRGAVLKTLLIMVVGLPGLAMVIAYLLSMFDATSFSHILGYFPCFSFDLALLYLGPNMMGMSSGASLYSLVDMLSMMSGQQLIPGFTVGSSIGIMCLVCVILGILCLIHGNRVIARRDM